MPVKGNCSKLYNDAEPFVQHTTGRPQVPRPGAQGACLVTECSFASPGRTGWYIVDHADPAGRRRGKPGTVPDRSHVQPGVTRPRRQRQALGSLLLAASVLSGCWPGDDGAAERADPYRCHAGNVDYALPTQTLTDWVTFADQLSVVEVIAEHRGEQERPAPGSDQAPWAGRRVDLTVLDTPWRRAGAPTAPDTLTVPVDPWVLRRGHLEQFRVSDGPWVGVGHRYLMGLVRFDGGEWGPFPRSTMPLDPAGVVVPTCPNHATLTTFTGKTAADAGAVLANTPADPAAAGLAALPPVERGQRVAARRPPGPPDMIDFVCDTDGTARTFSPEAVVQADGIHVRVANTTGAPVVARYDSPTGPGGGQEVPPGETIAILYLVPPGPLHLHCGQDTNAKPAPSTSVEVRDPAGYYRAVNVDDSLGCTITEHISDGQTAPFPTAAAALDALRATIGGQVTTSPGPGYKAGPGQTYLVYKDGHGYGLAETHPAAGGYTAEISQRCG